MLSDPPDDGSTPVWTSAKLKSGRLPGRALNDKTRRSTHPRAAYWAAYKQRKKHDPR
jgi:hypothetical protein